jgi:peroxiredoxin
MKKLMIMMLVMVLAAGAFAQMDDKNPAGLKVGDKAPDFTAMDQNGQSVTLNKLLMNGDVVVVFYRGQWCPFCNKQLSHINDSLSLIVAKKATVIAITPETAENVKKTIQKTKASYAVLEDKGMAIMKNYKVNFSVDAETVEKYKKYGIDFDKANGANGANLPVPATYIIGKNGNVKYVFFNPDYKLRPSVKEMLDNL